ncbi:nitroreductase family protein [Xylanibacter muris]|uniref:NAD(P)H nitroreductase n=1 Tax=Xylanibacter muris TaxID=2736290 RepID=A0ABX2AKM7_9BACT|nr:nitroreductase family protein [Xylanibacter muris]NPD91438.1 NAD(P)H nitroreductase [Xylanibacter muris]
MTDFKDLALLRRSHRKYASEEVDAEDLKLILRAALLSPTSKAQRAWQFIVVDDKTDIEKLSDAKDAGSHFLKDAPLAIVVLGNAALNDCWIEDGAIAAVSMQYQAEELGYGTCWIQIRGRVLGETSSEDVVRGILGIPDDMNVLCVLALGRKGGARKPQDEDNLKWENVHINKW